MAEKTFIVTPTWNNEDYTIRCFDSIRKNTSDYRIVWIDNGSEPEAREKVRIFLEENDIPHEKILNDENLGFVKATNQGMERAMEMGAEYIVFENNDTEVYEGWLERMIEVAESDPKIGLVGPVTSPCDSWQSIRNIKDKISEFSDLPGYDNNPEEYAKIIKEKYKGKKKEVSPMVAFFSTLVKAEVAKDIGFLSEEYGIGFNDDDDYCTRARNAGWKIAVAMDVFVFHNHRTTFKLRFDDEKIEEMKKENLTKFGNKFADDKDYDFEKLLRKGKMKYFKNKKAGNFEFWKKGILGEAVRMLKSEGLIKFTKNFLKFLSRKIWGK